MGRTSLPGDRARTPNAVGATPLTWRKYEEYELVGRRIVRPKAGAKFVEYSLADLTGGAIEWSEAASHETKRKERPKPLYGPLLEVVRDLRREGQGIGWWQLEPRHEEKVLAWCARFGLLGLFHQETRATAFPVEPTLDEKGVVVGMRPFSWRRPDGFIANDPPPGRGKDGASDQEELDAVDDPDAEFLDDDDGDPSSEFVPVHALDGSIVTKPIDEVWRHYFDHPDRQLWRGYPVPGSDDFWHLYGEPILGILYAATVVDEYVTGLMDGVLAGGALVAVRGILPSIWMNVWPDESGKIVSEMVPASLLGAMVIRGIDDARAGQKMIMCSVCRDNFLSARMDARYCSDRCAERIHKKVQRAKKKAHSRGRE